MLTELERRGYLAKQQQGAQLDFKLSMVTIQHDRLSGTLSRGERTINSHTGATGAQCACLRLTEHVVTLYTSATSSLGPNPSPQFGAWQKKNSQYFLLEYKLSKSVR